MTGRAHLQESILKAIGDDCLTTARIAARVRRANKRVATTMGRMIIFGLAERLGSGLIN